MVTFRPVDLENDRDLILELHVLLMFDAASDSERRAGYPAFRQRWINTAQPDLHIEAIRHSLQDARTIAEVIEVDGLPAGFSWTAFGELVGYDLVYAELREFALRIEYQRQGIGRFTLQHVEELARQRGASVLRSSGSARSEAALAFHYSQGFEAQTTLFEKPL